MPIHLEMCHLGRFNEYEEKVPDFVIGVKSVDDFEISRDHSWEMNLKSADSEKLETEGNCGHLELCQ